MYGIMFTLRSAQLPILLDIRNWLTKKSGFFNKLLSCSFCTGFHAGWITYLLVNPNFLAYFPFVSNIWGMAVYSFVSASFCYLLDAIIVKIES
jgi:hypothetical protein